MLQRLLRTLLIALSRVGWARRLVMNWGFAWRVASRFIAGTSFAEAASVVRALNARGINATLDYLGESTASAEEANAAAGEVIKMLEGIHAEGLRANVSLKLTQIGLALSEDLCRENLARILRQARTLGIFVRIDMEDSSFTGPTLATWDWARAQGFEDVGIVIQAYLYRSEEDIRYILMTNGRVRLCKGAYDEPSSVAFPQKKDVDANYDRLAALLLDGSLKSNESRLSADGRIPPIPALATHDSQRVQAALAEARRLDLPQDAFEFQMLYGIRRDLQEKLAAQGYPVRVYVPFGDYWYPYFMRRLAERPANIWFFLSNFFKK